VFPSFFGLWLEISLCRITNATMLLPYVFGVSLMTCQFQVEDRKRKGTCANVASKDFQIGGVYIMCR
jgi:hypothetical protein